METTINTSVYAGDFAVLPCAASATSYAVAAVRTWNDDATRGMKRDGFAPAHTQGSPTWSPPL